MSFLYEVNLEIDAYVAEKFGQWLTPHIEEMLSFDGFQSAQWYTRNREDEGVEKDVVLWTIQYILENREAYTQYVNTHAPRMRQEGLDLFGGSFQASRRLLHQHSSFNKKSYRSFHSPHSFLQRECSAP